MIVSRQEITRAAPMVAAIVLASMVLGYAVITGILFFIGFHDAALHYTLATVMPLLIGTVTVFPLVILTQRLRHMKGALEVLTRTDVLTDLPNRRGFFERAEKAFASPGGAIAVMMIDIDHFKSINDRYGHEAGDAVLQSVARTIRRVVSMVPGNGEKYAARIGGEEFCVLASSVDNAQAAVLAEAILQQVRQTICRHRGDIIKTTVSIGVASRRSDESVNLVLRAADHAGYRAKRLGRDQWRDASSVADRGPPDDDEANSVRLHARNS
ncbi:MAG: diguanylate cyclase [Hyphomicrobiales bacterium]